MPRYALLYVVILLVIFVKFVNISITIMCRLVAKKLQQLVVISIVFCSRYDGFGSIVQILPNC